MLKQNVDGDFALRGSIFGSVSMVTGKCVKNFDYFFFVIVVFLTQVVVKITHVLYQLYA